MGLPSHTGLKGHYRSVHTDLDSCPFWLQWFGSRGRCDPRFSPSHSSLCFSLYQLYLKWTKVTLHIVCLHFIAAHCIFRVHCSMNRTHRKPLFSVCHRGDLCSSSMVKRKLLNYIWTGSKPISLRTKILDRICEICHCFSQTRGIFGISRYTSTHAHLYSTQIVYAICCRRPELPIFNTTIQALLAKTLPKVVSSFHLIGDISFPHVLPQNMTMIFP